jgi:hypothetical protein
VKNDDGSFFVTSDYFVEGVDNAEVLVVEESFDGQVLEGFTTTWTVLAVDCSSE